MSHHITDGNSRAIDAHLHEREAYDEQQRLARLVLCETCGEEIDPDEELITESGDCEECHDAWIANHSTATALRVRETRRPVAPTIRN